MAGVYNESDLSLLVLMIPGLRILNENEMYYKQYSNWVANDKNESYEDEDYWDDEEPEGIINNILNKLRRKL